MTQVNINNLSKIFTSMDRPAVDNVNLEINNGELIALLGPSGCGKTTILKMITGIIHPDEGDILLDGESILSIPTEKRNIVMVFQNYLLFPYMTVNENVGFALKMKGIDNKEIEIKVKEMLELVKLPDVGNRKPKQLSGGMRKRVDLARGYAAEPEVLLMDEPFGALDVMTKEKLQEELHKLWVNNPKTIIFITHDVEEAVFLGNRVVLMTPRPGKIDLVIEPNLKINRDMSIKSESMFFDHVRKIRSRLKEN